MYPFFGSVLLLHTTPLMYARREFPLLRVVLSLFLCHVAVWQEGCSSLVLVRHGWETSTDVVMMLLFPIFGFLLLFFPRWIPG